MLKCPFIIHVLCLRVCSTICLASIFRNYLPRWAIVCVLFCSLWEISLNKSKSHIESQLRLEPSGGRGRGELLFQSITEPKHFTYRKTYFEKNNMYLFFFFNNKKSPESVLWFECSFVSAANEQNPSWCLLSRVSWEVLGILRCNIWEQGGGLSLAGVCPAWWWDVVQHHETRRELVWAPRASGVWGCCPCPLRAWDPVHQGKWEKLAS